MTEPKTGFVLADEKDDEGRPVWVYGGPRPAHGQGKTVIFDDRERRALPLTRDEVETLRDGNTALVRSLSRRLGNMKAGRDAGNDDFAETKAAMSRALDLSHRLDALAAMFDS